MKLSRMSYRSSFAARALICAVILIVSGCSDRATITVINHSGLTLSNLVLSGSGFTNRIATLAPGDQNRERVRVGGESGLRVSFDAAGRRIESGEEGYFEARYRVTAIIETNLSVHVSSER
jgi:hypothetical protein